MFRTKNRFERFGFVVADGNPRERSLIRTVLGSLGARRVHSARDGGEALTLIQAFPIDVVLCDLDMQPMDGLDLVRCLRSGVDSPAPFARIILIARDPRRVEVELARDLGIDAFLTKPLSLPLLQRRLEALTQEPRPFVLAPAYFGPDRRTAGSPRKPWPLRDRRNTSPRYLSDPLGPAMGGQAPH